MAEFRIIPKMISGDATYEVQRGVRILFWTIWAFECFSSTREGAELACRHLGGPIIHMSTEQRG